MIFNIYLFLTFAGLSAYHTYNAYIAGNLDFVEISFALQSLIFVTVILIRKPHQDIEKNVFNQMIALIAFYSAIAFIGQPQTGNEIENQISKIIIFAANILGVITLLNLGRSFGILIAFREIKTGGLYSVVRHPMYGTDILLRIGFIISHFNNFTIIIFIITLACYIYRARSEEIFLSQQSEYKDYMKKVRFMFIPYIV